jgi:hypothetical protein
MQIMGGWVQDQKVIVLLVDAHVAMLIHHIVCGGYDYLQLNTHPAWDLGGGRE